jgi:hypothetical protein
MGKVVTCQRHCCPGNLYSRNKDTVLIVLRLIAMSVTGKIGTKERLEFQYGSNILNFHKVTIRERTFKFG